jgi:cytochrome c oxidase cbb3-type subunit III
MMSARHVISSYFAIGVLAAVFAGSAGTASSQDGVSGQAIFTTNCGACHGSDGRGGERAPNIVTRREVVSRADADLIRAVEHGVPGTAMPAFGYLGDAKVEAVVKYLRTLQGIGVSVKAPGDPRKGQEIFFGKAGCSRCHMINGTGGFLSSDLSDYGAGRSIDDLRSAILNPGRNVDRKSQAVTVVLSDKEKYTGLIRSEDNFSLTLQSEDGSIHSLSKERLQRIEASGYSFMPDDYGSKLSSTEVDDLISFLLRTATSTKTATKTNTSDDDDND